MMRVVLVASVIPEYRLPALRMWSTLPGVSLKVLTTQGGDWATARGADLSHETGLDFEILPVTVMRGPGFSGVHMPTLRARIAEYSPDVIVAEPRMGLVSVVGLTVWPIRSNGQPVPVVWWMAGWRNTERNRLVLTLSDNLTRLVVRRGRAAACYSTLAAARAVQLGIPAERVVVAQNAVDTARLRELMSTAEKADFDGSLNMIFVGQVLDRKRLDVVVRAMAEGGECSRSRLRIIGRDTPTCSIGALASQLGVDDRIEWFAPTFDPRELAGHLMWADVGVLPAAGGLMLNTCMAAGVPVAAGCADGTERDLVLNGKTGWLLDADSQVYADWITECCEQRDRLRMMGGAAAAHVLRVASLEGMVVALTDACTRAVGTA